MKEKGSVSVEYAIVATAMVSLFILTVEFSKPDIFISWLYAIKKGMFISVDHLSDIPSLWGELTSR